MTSLRLAFMGSPDFAMPTLQALVEAGHEIVCVYSQPPKPAGRGKKLRPTAVHTYAEAHGLDVRTPRSLKAEEVQAEFAALNLDAAIVVAYGLILPQAVLDAPRLGCLNLHGSLLPRWRGAAPMQRAIMAGDKETGVQVMVMHAGLDTGPVLATAKTPISLDDTTGSLHDRLAVLGAELMPQTLAAYASGDLVPVAQTEDGATYASKLTADDQRIDWSRPATEVDCQIRGLSPRPGARFEWTPAGEDTPLKMKVQMSEIVSGEGKPGTMLDDQLTIACGTGAVRLLRLQKPGKGPVEAGDFLRGTGIALGTKFR